MEMTGVATPSPLPSSLPQTATVTLEETPNQNTDLAPPETPATDSTNKTTLGSEAVDTAVDTPLIGSFDDDLEAFLRQSAQDEEEPATMMLAGGIGGTMEFPTLKTKAWPCKNETPNPVIVNKATLFLAESLLVINCDMGEAGVHGHAWIIEDDETWEKQDGITKFKPPAKPCKHANTTVQERLDRADRLQECNLCVHLMNEAKSKIIEWFGQEMFVDLCKNGLLPAETTAKDLMAHLKKTCAQEHDCRRHLDARDKRFNKPLQRNMKVKTHFMQPQQAQADASLLKALQTSQQMTVSFTSPQT